MAEYIKKSIMPPAKPLYFVGNTRRDVQGFAKPVRDDIGIELFHVQQGRDPSDWKPMSDVGAGVREIRIRTGVVHRVLYVAKFEEAVYVLHSFQKKTSARPGKMQPCSNPQPKTTLPDQPASAHRRNRA